jgi:hypothetical protein
MLPSNGIDAKALRRMIEALLVRGGGVELNPGPVCPNVDLFVKGKMMKVGKSRFLSCPKCEVRLLPARDDSLGSMVGLHPAAVVFDDCECYRTGSSETFSREAKREARFASSASPKVAAPTCVGAPFVDPAIVSSSISPSVATFINSVQPCPPFVPPPAASAPPVVVPPPPSAVVLPSPVPAVANLATPPPSTLRGFVLPVDDALEVMENVAQQSRFVRPLVPADVTVSYHVIPYAQERRQLTQRGVPEVKASFDLVQMKAQVVVSHDNLALLFALFLFPAYLYAAWVMHTVLSNFWVLVEDIRSEISTDHYGPYEPRVINLFPFTAPFMLIGACCCVYWFYKKISIPSTVYLCYAPHLVTCLINEFDRGTSRDVVASTIRMKLKRMSAFPTPDVDAVQIIEGTERVVMLALERKHFFSRPAVCIPANL